MVTRKAAANQAAPRRSCRPPTCQRRPSWPRGPPQTFRRRFPVCEARIVRTSARATRDRSGGANALELPQPTGGRPAEVPALNLLADVGRRLDRLDLHSAWRLPALVDEHVGVFGGLEVGPLGQPALGGSFAVGALRGAGLRVRDGRGRAKPIPFSASQAPHGCVS
jgi:hypothetical protein